MIALGLDGDAKALVRPFRRVDVQQRELGQALFEHGLRDHRRCRRLRVELALIFHALRGDGNAGNLEQRASSAPDTVPE